MHSADLSQSARVLAAHHFDHKEIQVSVAVDVSKIDTHRGEGLMAHRQSGQQTKVPGAVVNPNAIHGLEIVAHVNVGEPVLVDVAHLDAQTEVPRRGKRFAVVVEEPF